MLETILSTCYTHLPLIISASTGTRYFAAVTELNTYVVYDLSNLDAYTLRNVHEQDLILAMHKITNYLCAIAHMLYST